MVSRGNSGDGPGVNRSDRDDGGPADIQTFDPIGEYLVRISEDVRQRPYYVIRRTEGFGPDETIPTSSGRTGGMLSQS